VIAAIGLQAGEIGQFVDAFRRDHRRSMSETNRRGVTGRCGGDQRVRPAQMRIDRLAQGGEIHALGHDLDHAAGDLARIGRALDRASSKASTWDDSPAGSAMTRAMSTDNPFRKPGEPRPPLALIAGPTASGKSDLPSVGAR
jgi:hypothetical protein